MWYLSFIRAIKSGASNFRRNGWLSFTASVVLALTLFSISFVIFLIFVYTRVLDNVKDQIAINVYFYPEVQEQKIQEIEEDLSQLPDIEKVSYTSREQALELFKEEYKDDPTVLESLDVIGDNPLGAYLSLKVENSNNLERIENELIAGKHKEFISQTDYSDNETTIEKLNNIIDTTQKTGALISMILIIIAVLVSFNSIRLTMYTHKNEIEIMRLVGASNWFIRLPFVTEGALYGLVASLMVFIVWYPLAVYLNPLFDKIEIPVNTVAMLNQNIFLIFPIQILIGIMLGISSSLLAIRRYLK